ncbi:hypothetical protein [Streptomyces eurythermus]
MADSLWTAPLGHSIPSHRVHGFCAHCRGRTVAEELAAWQVREQTRHETADDPGGQDDDSMPFVADVSTRAYSCPTCGSDDTVLEATFLVTTKLAVHQVGRFAFCFACERAQETGHA